MPGAALRSRAADRTSGHTFSVMVLIVAAVISTPYISASVPAMSRVDIPRAYMASIFSSSSLVLPA